MLDTPAPGIAPGPGLAPGSPATETPPVAADSSHPGVGLHPGVPGSEYHAWPLPSNSRLGDLLRSPAFCRYRIDNPEPDDTGTLRVGSATHCAVLEPDRFEETYTAPASKLNLRKKADSEVWEALKDQYGEEHCLRFDEHGSVCRMAAAVHQQKSAARLLERIDTVEVSGVFEEPETGVLCKFRADALAAQNKTVVDLKTTKDASRSEFERSIFNFGYHRQAAFYLDGLRALGYEFDHFVIIAVEKTQPHLSAVYRVLDDAIELGRREYRAALTLWDACHRTGVWPGYPSTVQDIGVPAWAESLSARRLEDLPE